MKKNIALILVFMILIVQSSVLASFMPLGSSGDVLIQPQASSASVSGSVYGYASVWEDGFESYGSIDDLKINYSLTNPTSGTVEISSDKKAGGAKSLKVTDTTTTNGLSISKRITAVDDVMLEVNLFAEGWKATDFISVNLYSGSSTFLRIYIKGDGLYYKNPTTGTKICDFPFGTWTKLRVETNLVQGTFMVYVNGAKAGEGLDLDNKTYKTADGISIAAGNGPVNYSFYVDDLIIAKKVEVPGNFALQSPVNEAVDVPMNTVFQWGAAQNADSYRLEISEDESFTNNSVNTTVSAITYEVTGLKVSQKYFWRLTALNSGGETSCTEVFSFTTVAAVEPEEPEEPVIDYVEFYREGFEDYNSREDLQRNYTYTVPAGCTLEVTDEKKAEGEKSLRFTDNVGGAGINLYKSITAVNDIMLELNLWTNDYITINLYSGASQPQRLYIKDGGLFYTGGSTRICDFPFSQWNKLRVETDLAAGTFKVYVNGQLKGKDLKMDSKADSLDQVSITTTWGAQNCTMYVDDLIIARKPYIPESFDLQYPQNGAVSVGTKAVFTWNPSGDAARYKLQISEHDSFDNPSISRIVSAKTSEEVEGLKNNLQYFWRVIAQNSAGETNCGSVFSFTTIGAEKPGEFSLLSPAYKAENVGPKPVLKWEAATNTSKFIITLAKTPDFTDPVTYETAGNITEIVPESPLESGCEYFWKVTAVNEDIREETPGAAVYSFTTQCRIYLEKVSLTDFFGNAVSETALPGYVRVGAEITCNMENADLMIVFELSEVNGFKERVLTEKRMAFGDREGIKADFLLPEDMGEYTIKVYVCKSSDREDVLSNIISIFE